MSSLSNLPYGKILDYWYEKLKHRPEVCKFLALKVIEINAFKTRSEKLKKLNLYQAFQQPKENNIDKNLEVSIVIPGYVRSEKDCNDLSRLLESIQRQVTPPKEVILVDDFSPMPFTVPDNVKLHRLSKNSGPAAARNVGKRIAVKNGADLVAFTDLDCELVPNWIETVKRSAMQASCYHLFSGNTISGDRQWFGRYHEINGTLNGRKLANSDRLLYGTTANLAMTREVASILNFNENFTEAAGEDIEFCFRANQKGFAIMHVPEMIVQHNYGYGNNFWQNLKRFRTQFRKYGQGERILLKEVPDYYNYFNMSEEIPSNNNIVSSATK